MGLVAIAGAPQAWGGHYLYFRASRRSFDLRGHGGGLLRRQSQRDDPGERRDGLTHWQHDVREAILSEGTASGARTASGSITTMATQGKARGLIVSWPTIAVAGLPIILALLVTIVILLAVGAPPLDVYA